MMRFGFLSALLAAALLLGGCAATGGGPSLPDGTEAPDGVAAAPGYVRITVGSDSRWIALPGDGERVVTLRQTAEDGTELINEVHLSPEGVFMGAASCHNQDCVKQGQVTFENRDTRVLTNWVICLPNQVSVELYTPEEMNAMGGSGEGGA